VVVTLCMPPQPIWVCSQNWCLDNSGAFVCFIWINLVNNQLQWYLRSTWMMQTWNDKDIWLISWKELWHQVHSVT
jgi:hypothetical protein